MRILHVSRSAETIRAFLIPTMNAQKSLGHEVFVCARESRQAERLREEGFEVFTHRLRRTLNPLRIFEAILVIRRVLIEKGIDVAVCHTIQGAVIGRLAAWIARTPRIVYFTHGLACSPAQGPVSWRVRYQAEKSLAGLTDAILVMNDYDERLSRRAPLAKRAEGVYRIAGMGVDPSRFSPRVSPEVRDRIGRELGFGRDQKLVICTARLIPEKGVVEYIEAAKQIVRARGDVFFILVGIGPLSEKLKATVNEAGLESRIRVLGWRNDVPDLMQSADVFVLPSFFMEGLPVSILEAMACGKPVVSTHHKGCEDAVVDEETGFLVPVRDVPALVERITRLLDDPQLRARMGGAGRRRIEEHFELGRCTKQIVDVLETIARNGTS
jgi:glycosyltransferase involved in cell wall biosynthesis